MREQLTSFLQTVLNSLGGEVIALGLIVSGTTVRLLHAEQTWQTAGDALVVAGTTRLGTKL
jgi:hypothetical protein